MKDVIIVGAGGFGREVVQIINDNNKIKREYNILGFIDDNANALNGKKCNYAILDSISSHSPKSECIYICAIANPLLKEKIMLQLKQNGAKFESLIHHTASVSEYASLGEGLVAYPNSWIGADAIIGDFVTLLSSNIGHDAQVGSFTTISSNCDLTREVNIGKRCFLGSSVSIIPERKIGDDVYICAGSVVFTNVKEGRKVMGYPAKRVNL